MWTLLWIDDSGCDRWQRFASRIHLKAFMDRNELADDSSAIIFPPGADDMRLRHCDLYEEVE